MAKPKVYVAKTKNTGKGIFAGRSIKKGEYIFTVKGEYKKFTIKNQKDSDSWKCTNCIAISKEKWIDPFKENFLTYTNHSCNPNAGLRGSRRFYAMRDIKVDEEITFDYSTSEIDTFWDLGVECKCGEKNCRKIIKSIQFLPKKTFEKHMPFIATRFITLYRVSIQK